MADFKPGDHVRANFGAAQGAPDGPVIAHVDSGPKDNDAGETKYGIQAPDGKVHPLGFREPGDRDEHGSGGTFWSI